MLTPARLALFLFLAAQAPAQEGYRLPAEEIVDLVAAPLPPDVRLSPDGKWAAFVQRAAMPSIADMSRRMLRLGGMRIDPAADSRFTTSFATSVSMRLTGEPEAEPVLVALPDGARVTDVSWSHDSLHFVVTIVTDSGSELWGGTVDSPETIRRLVQNLSTVTGGPHWHPDGVHVLCRTVPVDRDEEPPAPAVPSGPIIQETTGEKTPTRTYQDLLGSPHDADLFDHYVTSDLTLVSVSDGESRVITRGVHLQAEISPDGEWLLESVLHRPYSYLMPMYTFPQHVQVRRLSGGDPILLAEIPQVASVPIGGVRTGPRSYTWSASSPATLLWAEALDGGDPEADVPHRDRWLALAAPFDAEARELVRVEHRARGLTFLADPQRLITSEYDRDRRWTRTLLHELGGAESPRVLEDRSIRDRYADPGSLVMTTGPFGRPVVREEGGAALRTGSGASPEGNLPFLRRQNLSTGEVEELWRCEPGSYERVVDVLAAEPDVALGFVTRHEDPTSPPNLRLRQVGAGEPIASLTSFPDPTPELRGVTQELVTYEREDGVPLSATLYLPADYEEGQRLPLFVWAYPREYNDARTAGQVSGSPWRFTTVRGASHLVLLTQGYAVLDGATMPIIGDVMTMNDTFREQLVASAAAAIDFAVERGVADRDRVAVGGHSYGAFMTANLLAHSDLFRAGIARSGAYNRTLTPFGFQSEQRTVWEAPATYFAVSPFLHAHRINEPLLLIHGAEDNNSGTFPMQSRRMFQALEGHGATAKLVMLPSESHGYRARESVLHCLAEMVAWCDAYVKAGGERTGGTAIEASASEGEER